MGFLFWMSKPCGIALPPSSPTASSKQSRTAAFLPPSSSPPLYHIICSLYSLYTCKFALMGGNSDVVCMTIFITFFASLMHFSAFLPHFPPVSFGITIIRLLEGMYHSSKPIPLTSYHILPHIYHILLHFHHILPLFPLETVKRLIKGIYHPSELISLTSYHILLYFKSG